MFSLINKPPIKVKWEELELHLFDPKKDNWEEVRRFALTTITETVPKVLKDVILHPVLNSVLAILAGVFYQMTGSLLFTLLVMIAIYLTMYIIFFWVTPLHEIMKQVDCNFVEYWTKPNHPLWLLFDKGKLIGSVGLKELDVDTRGEIGRMVIAKEYRRNGLAEKLVYVVIEYCEEHNCDELIVETSLYQPAAMKLYEKVGFTLYKKYTLYYFTPMLRALSIPTVAYKMKIPRK